MSGTRSITRDNDSPARPSRAIRLTNAAAPSKEGRNLGNMKPPSWLAAYVTPPESAASISFHGDSAVVITSASRDAQSWAARWLAVTGRATRTGSPPTPVTNSRKTIRASSLVSTRPVPSTNVRCSPPASMTAPMSAPEARTDPTTRAALDARSTEIIPGVCA